MSKIQEYRKLPMNIGCVWPEGQQAECRLMEINREAIHMHDYLELVYFMSGIAEVKISFNTFRLESGEFLLINPCEVHQIKSSSDKPVVALVMRLDTSLIKNKDMVFHPDFYNKEEKEFSDKVVSSMIQYWTKINAALNPSDELSKIASICNEKFCVQYYAPDNNIEKTKEEMSMSGIRVYQLYDFLYENYDQNLRLEDIARVFNLDASYTSRIIRRDTGTSFIELLNIIRTDRSEIYLLSTSDKISFVGNIVGFVSYDTFNKSFQKCFGQSPGAYRKRYQQETWPNSMMDSRIITWGNHLPDFDNSHENIMFQELDDRYVITVFK